MNPVLSELPAEKQINESIGNCYTMDHMFIEHDRCLKAVYKEYQKHAQGLCAPSCNDIHYETQFLTAPWPVLEQTLPFYALNIKNRSYADMFGIYGEILTEQEVNGSTVAREMLLKQDIIQRNFARIQIKLDFSKIYIYKDVPTFTFTSFVSSLGGLLNLYSGISCVVFIEIIDLFYNILAKYLSVETKQKCKESYGETNKRTSGGEEIFKSQTQFVPYTLK